MCQNKDVLFVYGSPNILSCHFLNNSLKIYIPNFKTKIQIVSFCLWDDGISNYKTIIIVFLENNNHYRDDAVFDDGLLAPDDHADDLLGNLGWHVYALGAKVFSLFEFHSVQGDLLIPNCSRRRRIVILGNFFTSCHHLVPYERTLKTFLGRREHRWLVWASLCAPGSKRKNPNQRNKQKKHHLHLLVHHDNYLPNDCHHLFFDYYFITSFLTLLLLCTQHKYFNYIYTEKNMIEIVFLEQFFRDLFYARVSLLYFYIFLWKEK